MEKDFADIITLINEHPLVTVTPATTRVLRTPEEIREEALKLKTLRDEKDSAHSPLVHKSAFARPGGLDFTLEVELYAGGVL